MLNISYKTNINGEWIKVNPFNPFDKIPNNVIIIDCSSNKLTSLPEWKYWFY